jgi:hypothetical protein
MLDELWAELCGEDWDESEDGDAGAVVGDGD